MSGTTKKFLVENFANIAIALSVIFLIFELNQNRRMMERELVFMEAQAYQSRAEIALEMNLEEAMDRDLVGLVLRAKQQGLSDLTDVERQVLFHYYNARRVIGENVFQQTQLGLLPQEFFNEVGRKGIERDGALMVALEVPMNPAYKRLVDSVLAESSQSMSGS
tara:strand:- start:303 stop:794 length:492 start_codon:yes stop_codon:yes gene_type:complete